MTTKRELETQLQKAQATITELQDRVKGSLGLVAERLPELISGELDLALPDESKGKVKSTTKERATARRYLIDLLVKMTEIEDLKRGPMDDITDGWSKVTLERNMDGESTSNTAEAGNNSVAGTGIRILPVGYPRDTDNDVDGGRG